MTHIIALVGIPGSGKTTLRNELIKTLDGTYVVVSRDDIRVSLFGSLGLNFTKEREALVSKTKREMIHVALSENAGTIIIDETHCTRHGRNSTIGVLDEVAYLYDYTFEYMVTPLSFDIDKCHKNNTKRGDSVPFHRIEQMHTGFLDFVRLNNEFCPDWLPTIDEIDNATETNEILVDIDGTIAERVGRGSFDWDRVGEDEPRRDIIDIIKNLCDQRGASVVIFSGRDEVCREQTEKWLHDVANLRYTGLYMRPEGNTERDFVIKMKALKEHFICNKNGSFKPAMIFDDRLQVVRYWRALGITTLQVGAGVF